MSFFDQQHDATRRENLDPRVSAWMESKPNTASSPGYAQMAQNVQKTASDSRFVGGKLVTPIYAKPRDTLPSNVRGFHNRNKAGPSSLDTEYHSVTNRSLGSAWSVTTAASVQGQSGNAPAFAGSASRLSGPDFIPDVRGVSARATGQASSSTAPPVRLSNAPITPTPSAGNAALGSFSTGREIVPPHLRPSPNASPASIPGSSKDSKNPSKMNAGKVAQLAKDDSKFPCTYRDCTRGFAKEKDLKNHKDEEHEWCRVCKMDFEELDDLFEHKKYSDRHICCLVCGEDFRSEAGRDRHQRQMHSTEQNVHCPGCGYTFEKGAGLIAHIHESRCNSGRGQNAERLTQFDLLGNRARAALYMDEMSHRPSNTGALIAAMQPSEAGDHQSVDESVGDVVLTPNFMDDDTPYGGTVEVASTLTGASNLIEGEQSTVKDEVSVAPNMVDTTDWPTVEESKTKGKKKEESVIQGLGALTVRDSSGPVSDPKASALYIKPTPILGEWGAPTMPDYRRNILPSESGSQHLIRTDWDNMQFERHGLDGMYYCPFAACKARFMEVNDLKYHLGSGYHQGTDHRCLKCLKIFKSPMALIAHMESNSERCRMKDTYGFGHVLHVVSGGFLGVTGRYEDGSIKIQAPVVEKEQRHILRLEESDDDDDEGEKPRKLMSHRQNPKQLIADEMLS